MQMYLRRSLLLCAKYDGFLSVQVAIGGHYHKVLGHWTRETVLQLNSLWVYVYGEREREREIDTYNRYM